MNWYLEVLKNYAVFSGRARRKEYWMFVLFNIIIVFVLSFIEGMIGTTSSRNGQSILTNIYQLAIIIPSIAVGVRRMHDTDHSGWWLLFPIVNLVFAVSEGTQGDNKYGPDPKTFSQITNETQQKINSPSLPTSVQAKKAFSSNEQGTKSFTEKDNLGTNVDTHSRGDAYWHTRMVQGPDYPFVIYYFDNEKNAREALLELPCIHVAQDSQRLICTEVLDFGYYPAKNEAYAAFICGKDLTHELWEQAKTSFAKHNGTPRNEQEPEKSSAPVQPATAARPDKVVFVKEMSGQNQVGATYIKKRYSAPDAASAKAFLQQHPVTQQFYYIEIDTPEGNFGRDIQGIYTY